MDKKKVFWMIGIFLIGVIIGGVIMCLVCCNCNYCCRKSCKESCKESYKEGCEESSKVMQNAKELLPGSDPARILVDAANAYFKCYMKTPVSINKLEAFSVNLQQFKAMQLLLEHNTAAAGFRIYMGIVGDPVTVNMVVATDAAGKDNASEIYMTKAAGPCPDLCDKDSPITK